MFENHRHRFMPVLYVVAGVLLTLGAIGVLNYVHLIPAIPGLPRVGSVTRTQVDPQTLQSHLVAQNKQTVYSKEYDQGVQFNQSNTPAGPFHDFIERFWHTDATFTAYGSVDVQIDYSKAKAESGPDHTIIITLPAPALGKVYLDADKSTVDGVRCGVNVLCHANEAEFYKTAQAAFTEDAAKDLANTSPDGLGGKARTQAEANVKQFASQIGADPSTITVRFAS
jgi:hypothetical protein